MRLPLVAAIYAVAIQVWLSLGKPVLSWLLKQRTSQAPIDYRSIPTGSLDDYARWLESHTEWTSDPLGGLLDSYPSEGYLGWQLRYRNRVRDDCDGLAYLAALTVRPLVDPGSEPVVVSVTLAPGWTRLADSVHAVCVFRNGGRWRVASNGRLDPGAWATFDEAVHLNAYCRAKPIAGWEVRDTQLRRIPAPRP